MSGVPELGGELMERRNATDVFNDGHPADNLTSMQNTIVKFEGEINEIYLTNLNEASDYRFGVGSRFAVYAR